MIRKFITPVFFCFLLKAGFSQQTHWAKNAGSTGNDGSYGIAMEENGNVYVGAGSDTPDSLQFGSK